MKPTVLSFPVFSLRRIETPFEREPGYKNYVAVVNLADLPDLKDWRKINVRDPKIRGRVPEAIRESLVSKPEEFLFLNRGLVIAAERVDYSEGGGREKTVRLTMKDPSLHGLLDGGHTYRVLMDERHTWAGTMPQHVRVEIITGFDEDGIVSLVDARNTSNQVKDESLENLKGSFDAIKDVLKDELYYDQIAWSEYEELESGKPKPIDVRELISYLIVFDTKEFNGTKQPLIAYKDKRACLNHFREHETRLRKYYRLLPEILLLWDDIHDNWFGWYKAGRLEEAGIPGRPGGLTGIANDKLQQLHFRQKEAAGRIPEAYKYPILSAFRAGVDASGKQARWQTEPFELLMRTGPRLVGVVGNSIRSYNNPNRVGKDVGTWSSCYLIVESSIRDSLNVEKERVIQKLEAELRTLRADRKS